MNFCWRVHALLSDILVRSAIGQGLTLQAAQMGLREAIFGILC